MRTIIAMMLVLASSVANAAPVSLLCRGTAERKILSPARFPDSVSMVVDVGAKTLTLDNDGALPNDVLPIETASDSVVTVHGPGVLGDPVSVCRDHRPSPR